MRNRDYIRRLTVYALLTSLSMIFSYIESAVALPLPVPGIKLGLANIVSLFLLYNGGLAGALAVSAARCALTSFLFGTGLWQLAFSLSGAVLSLVGMYLIMKTGRFSIFLISMAGGILHNAGQLLVAFFTIGGAAIGYYAPVLLLSGAVCGLITAACARAVFKVYKGGRIE
ncbi:MAG: Gx transporter family protein [Eubacteriales bacterium]|nr:Gx transporter family protein [Eubacteriales bacterium]MDD3883163.1 Gx transporter family protein [Eubacteriales bacterium]MDD4512454.1 Gx transporter family protein [Eubacteriales bacterium]